MFADIAYEALTILSLLVSGWALVRSVPGHDPDGPTVTLFWSVAYGGGATIVAFVFTSLLHVNRPGVMLLPPLLALSLHLIRRGRPSELAAIGGVLRVLAGLGAVSVAATVTARSLRLGIYTGDTFQLVASARALADNRRATSALISPFSFEEFPPGYSLLQIPSTWGGHTANHGLGVLLSLAILGLLGHALRSARNPPPPLAIAAVLGALASSHFFWVMTTYINAHAVVALFLLATFLRVSRGQGHVLDDLPMLLMVAGLVVLRVENVLLVALMLTTRIGLPDGADPTRLRTTRMAIAVAGTAGLTHQGVILALYRSAGQSLTRSSLGLAAIAAGLVVAAILLRPLVRARILPVRWALPALLAANVGYAALDLRGFATSVTATLQNLFFWEGGWGALPPLMLGLAITAVVATRGLRDGDDDTAVLLSFCLAAAMLLFFTGYLREVPFRAGGGDSLNRQLFHLVPLALLAIGRAIGIAEADCARSPVS